MDSTFRRTANIHLQDLIDGLLDGNRVFLSKAITLVESKRQEDRVLSAELIDRITGTPNKSFRVGITGVPGVGKAPSLNLWGKC